MTELPARGCAPTQAETAARLCPQRTRNRQPQEDTEIRAHSHQQSAPHRHPPTAPPCHLPLPSALQPRAPTQHPAQPSQNKCAQRWAPSCRSWGSAGASVWERGRRGTYQTPCKQGPCCHPPAVVPCPRSNKSEAATSQRLGPIGLPPLAGAQAHDGRKSGARSWYPTTGTS